MIDKPRLLKVTLSSIQEKINILKNKQSSNYPSPVRNIFITPDYTPMEQKKNKALRQQLADMKVYRVIISAENTYCVLHIIFLFFMV